MFMILIGIDPHKHTHTLVAVDSLSRQVIDQITVPARAPGHRHASRWIQAFGPTVLVGVEDNRVYSSGIETQLIQDRIRVVRVPPSGMGRSRRHQRTRGKSDQIDAAAVAWAAPQYLDRVAIPTPAWKTDLQLVMADRDALVAERTRACARVRGLIHTLDPHIAPRLRGMNAIRTLNRLADHLHSLPGIAAGIAAELTKRIIQLTRTITTRTTQITRILNTYAPQLTRIPGCGPISAGRLIANIQITQFPSPAKLARHAGIAPIPASSGTTSRHRLDRTGHRQLNYAIHQIAFTQARCHPQARAYITRRKTEGKTFREALRCLKRHLVNTIYRALNHGPTWHPSLT